MAGRQLAQMSERLGPFDLFEFRPVAAGELGEPGGVMAVPFAQFR
jgi:hypothetical protein